LEAEVKAGVDVAYPGTVEVEVEVGVVLRS